MKPLFAIFMGLVSCSSLKPHPELIQNFSRSLQAEELFRAPYVSEFSRADQSLWFVAIQHSDLEDSTSFKTILKAYDQFQPKVILIEGVEDIGVLSPPDHSAYVMKMAKQHFKGSSESTFAAWLAISHQIPYAPSEPSDASIGADFEKAGRSRLDYAYFDVARTLPQWKRQGKIRSFSDYKKKAKEYGSRAFSHVGVASEFKFEEFLKWFHDKTGHELGFNNLSAEDFTPQLDENPTELNRLSSLVDESREKHIHEVMVKMLNQFKRVMVVFGSGHLVKHRKVLTELLGKSHDEKWF